MYYTLYIRPIAEDGDWAITRSLPLKEGGKWSNNASREQAILVLYLLNCTVARYEATGILYSS